MLGMSHKVMISNASNHRALVHDSALSSCRLAAVSIGCLPMFAKQLKLPMGHADQMHGLLHFPSQANVRCNPFGNIAFAAMKPSNNIPPQVAGVDFTCGI